MGLVTLGPRAWDQAPGTLSMKPTWQAGQAAAHARHTEAHVGGQNIDFSLVSKAKTAARQIQHSSATLHWVLRNRQDPYSRQAVWGINVNIDIDIYYNVDIAGYPAI